MSAGMHAAVTLSSSPTRSGTAAMTSRTTRPMAANETAAITHPSSPIRTRSRVAVIGTSSRVHSASGHAASEIAASEITETADVASDVAERATVAKPGIPIPEIAAFGVESVGGGVGSPGGPFVVSGIAKERIGDHAADHHPSDGAHEVAHHETSHAHSTHAHACRHTGPRSLQRARLPHLGPGGEPSQRTWILVISSAGSALGRGQRRVPFLQHHAALFRC